MTGEVLPHDVLVLIDLDDAVVIRVRDQGVAVLQPAGKSNTTHRIADVRVAAAVLPDNIAAERDRARDLDGAVVIFVADENVAVLQKLCAVRIVELIGTVAGDARGAVLPDDSIGSDIDLNDSLVRLICDEHVAIGKPGVLYRNVELIGATSQPLQTAHIAKQCFHRGRPIARGCRGSRWDWCSWELRADRPGFRCQPLR